MNNKEFQELIDNQPVYALSCVTVTYSKLFEEIGELQERIDKAIEYIKTNCILSDTWKEIDFANFVPIGRIKYKSLSSRKVENLLNILQRSDKDED